MATIEDFKILQYIKYPVNNVVELYIRYPEGGEKGWYSYSIEDKTFAYWDANTRKWELFYANSMNTGTFAVNQVDLAAFKIGTYAIKLLDNPIDGYLEGNFTNLPAGNDNLYRIQIFEPYATTKKYFRKGLASTIGTQAWVADNVISNVQLADIKTIPNKQDQITINVAIEYWNDAQPIGIIPPGALWFAPTTKILSVWIPTGSFFLGIAPRTDCIYTYNKNFYIWGGVDMVMTGATSSSFLGLDYMQNTQPITPVDGQIWYSPIDNTIAKFVSLNNAGWSEFELSKDTIYVVVDSASPDYNSSYRYNASILGMSKVGGITAVNLCIFKSGIGITPITEFSWIKNLVVSQVILLGYAVALSATINGVVYDQTTLIGVHLDAGVKMTNLDITPSAGQTTGQAIIIF